MKRLGFIGLGNMGGAIARGLAAQGGFELLGFNPSQAKCDHYADIMTILPSGRDVAAQSDLLLLAVKPQVMRPVLTDLVPALRPGTCILSIAAGITLEQLAAWSGQGCPVVRIMPNTPAMIGQGVYALCFEHVLLTDDLKNIVTSIFASIGQAHVLPEKLFDAFSGLIGCGPAYVFAFMEALIDAGLTLGLTRPQTTRMVTALVTGSARMVEQEGAHPTILKEQVTSPGGSTIVGLNALDEHRFKFAISQAVLAATRRNNELGR